MTALEDIAAERKRQTEEEGWSLEHDDGHENGELALAAAAYACNASDTMSPFANLMVDRGGQGWQVGTFLLAPLLWPWEWSWWKPRNKRRDLVRAGALIVAEIERLDRMQEAFGPRSE